MQIDTSQKTIRKTTSPTLAKESFDKMGLEENDSSKVNRQKEYAAALRNDRLIANQDTIENNDVVNPHKDIHNKSSNNSSHIQQQPNFIKVLVLMIRYSMTKSSKSKSK